MTIRVKAIIGSTSSTSYNRRLVNFMKKRYADRLDITLVSINDVEMFSVDHESEPPANVRAFKENVKDSDAVLFAVPEYNFSIPGALKNALDWLSRGGEATLRDKPAFIVGSSMGVFGSVRAQIHLREILSNPGLSPLILPNNEVYIGSIHQKLSDDDELTDAPTVAFLDSVVNNFVDFYERMTEMHAAKKA
ncbi:NAD(P)H-dependent oxidoreductase [Sporosarcina jeotgali]|uniref:NAD(P)H-dependent oxidoreductase n=1 Tax=Sporosarcina jeotgali TaxID=3020056 RepID=A0ABZ0KWD0_9BACL|nr:NADPH-dependent FMN reductase [Sporosarcina sp. B2O-1]WOV83741.1 NAD(P)H-dependent oxidoreductase [Sporosarcina sp. B2O-1]